MPEYRGLGICDDFVKLVIKKSRTIKVIDFIRSDTILPNDSMEHVLQKNGFEKMCEYDDCWKRGDKYFSCAMYRLKL